MTVTIGIAESLTAPTNPKSRTRRLSLTAQPFCTEVKMRSPIGIVRIRLVERGRVGWEYEGRNLFVNAGRPALAALLGGDTTGEFAAAVGFGTGSNAPTLTDSALTTPAYYKALDGHSEDGNGSLTLNWSLTTADTGAQGITIQALALL